VTSLKKAFEHIREFALGYPETREDHPWGESAIKVRGKTFVFMGLTEGKFGLSVKLPRSHEFALDYPFTKSTGYGLGSSGWVSASFVGKDEEARSDIAGHDGAISQGLEAAGEEEIEVRNRHVGSQVALGGTERLKA